MKNTKINSKKQEKRVAKELGGKTVVASGALWGAKGDVRLDKFLIECKTTEKSEYVLDVRTWQKIATEALRDGMRTPLMQIELESGKTRLAVISYIDFIGYDFDDFNFVMDNQPKLLDAKSYRVSGEFLNYLVGVDLSNPEIKNYIWVIREDVKFVDYQIHLVIVKWEDFLYMLGGKQNE